MAKSYLSQPSKLLKSKNLIKTKPSKCFCFKTLKLRLKKVLRITELLLGFLKSFSKTRKEEGRNYYVQALLANNSFIYTYKYKYKNLYVTIQF